MARTVRMPNWTPDRRAPDSSPRSRPIGFRSAAASQSATARVPRAECGSPRASTARNRRETTLGAADDTLDADGQRVLDYAQAQAKARDWLASLHGAAAPGPYTINRCLDDYIADYKRRGGKALDRLEITANAFIRPQLGAGEIGALTAAAIRK